MWVEGLNETLEASAGAGTFGPAQRRITQHKFFKFTHILYREIKFLMLYKMALKIKEFDVNYITAIGGKSVNGLKFANFRYKNSNAQSVGSAHGPEGTGTSSHKFPPIIIYGGMKVVQEKFGNYLELDIKDNKTEEFFKSLEEPLLRPSASCLGEKPWNTKSPLINYGGAYTVRCKIYPNSCLGNVGRSEGRKV